MADLSQLLEAYRPKRTEYSLSGGGDNKYLDFGGSAKVPMTLGDLLFDAGGSIHPYGVDGGFNVGYEYPMDRNSSIQASVGRNFSASDVGAVNSGRIGYSRRW